MLLLEVSSSRVCSLLLCWLWLPRLWFRWLLEVDIVSLFLNYGAVRRTVFILLNEGRRIKVDGGVVVVDDWLDGWNGQRMIADNFH